MFFVSLLILFRALGDVDSEDILLSCNPAYVAIESYLEGKPEEATGGSFHQSASPDTLRKGLV